jgi:DNA mismatch endonuclease (patch repair protein)
MAAVRSRGNKETELKLAVILRAARITGWRRHQQIVGRPDFAFRRQHLVIFVDGCFWHGCPLHCRTPLDNREYWQRKISRVLHATAQLPRRSKHRVGDYFVFGVTPCATRTLF